MSSTEYQPQRNWRKYLFFGVLAYFIIINQLIRVRPDHIALALLVLSLALGKEKARKYLVDWIPFVLFWIAYDMMRGMVDGLLYRVHVEDVFKAELTLFGWIFDGTVPPFYLQELQYRHAGSIFKEGIDLLCGNFYSLHFAAPLLVGWILWHTANDRHMYYRFIYTLTVLNLMALITFLLFPAAPPWYVFQHGFAQPTGDIIGAAGGLINIDRMFKMKLFMTIWHNMNPNHFAAIPSLHGAYPIIASYFIYAKFKKYPVLLAVYPAGTWFAAVYLNHHYVIDLLIGAAYMLIAYQVCHRVLMPKIFERTVLRDSRLTFPDRE